MSQENVEILRKLQNDWNRGERDLAGAYHPDVEFLPRRAATEGGYYGLSGIEAFIADTSEVFDKYEMNFEFTDLGERVLAFGTIHVRAKGSGVETDIQTGGLFEFRDGRIVRWEDFGSKARPLKPPGCRSSALDESSSLNSCVSERSDRRPDSSLATTVPGSARPIDTQLAIRALGFAFGVLASLLHAEGTIRAALRGP
jgi:ketosteroid isomerase-like protein